MEETLPRLDPQLTVLRSEAEVLYGRQVFMTERVIQLDGIALCVAEAGVGGHPLLLLHGFTGAKEDFTLWLDRLARAGWHTVVPDLRGHGGSDKPPSEDAYCFDAFVDDTLDLADALGWEHFVLLGHSMGGMVAQIVATRVPARLRGLVLMSTGHGPVEGLDPAMVEAARHLVRAKGMDVLADALADRASPLNTPSHERLLATLPGYKEFGDGKLRATSPAMYAAMASSLLSTADRINDLRGLPPSLPVLVMVGEEDRPFL